jgi:type VI secretion system protein ImpG
LDEFACADPYVERLLEGFAFIAARVHLKLDAEFPQFTQAILETVYPHYLSPTPSMAVVEFAFDMAKSSISKGFEIERGTALRSVIGPDERTACEYRTGHPVLLWPIKITQADYLAQDLRRLKAPLSMADARAGIRIRLETPAEIPFSNLDIDELTFFIRGPEALPVTIYEQIFAHGKSILIQSVERPYAWQQVLPSSNIEPVGFLDDEALLPVVARSFRGYRLLQEYFVFPHQRTSSLFQAVQRPAN